MLKMSTIAFRRFSHLLYLILLSPLPHLATTLEHPVFRVRCRSTCSYGVVLPAGPPGGILARLQHPPHHAHRLGTQETELLLVPQGEVQQQQHPRTATRGAQIHLRTSSDDHVVLATGDSERSHGGIGRRRGGGSPAGGGSSFRTGNLWGVQCESVGAGVLRLVGGSGSCGLQGPSYQGEREREIERDERVSLL